MRTPSVMYHTLGVAAAILIMGSTAGAQANAPGTWTYGVAVGSPAAGLPLPEAVVGIGRATWHSNRRFALRSELTVSHLPLLQGDLTPPCPTDHTCFSTPRKPNAVAGLSEQVILSDDYLSRGETRGGYYVLGGGMYREVSPTAVGSIGGSLEGGLGFKFGGASLEVKVVYIRHWIGGDSGLIPVTIGYTW